ncbi:hypothetical protein ACOI1C_08575 [Bacillus sp. DJP31]|uniref:hypothetical protein n=1 Tax=Bacillus sp. DJP31 TaxID=3409789 RepID=UPI003BB65BF3
MERNPIYTDSLANIWHHELSPENRFNDIDLFELQEGYLFDEFADGVTSFY